MIDDVTAILDALRRIVQAVRASAAASERAIGISGAQLFVLRALAQEGPLTPGELAARTATHPSSVSGVAAKLVSAGLARRARDASDGRRVALNATARGRALLAGAQAPEQERLVHAVRLLGPARRRFLADALGELERAMGLSADEAPPMLFDLGASDRAPRTRPRRRGARTTRSRSRAARSHDA